MFRRRLLATVFLVAMFCLGAWLERVWLLRSAAAVWIVSDPVACADAVAVFGGGVEDRAFVAAEYYRLGLVSRVLVSGVAEGPAEKLGALASDTAASRIILLRLGVPESAIEIFGSDLRNTHQETLALLEWAQREGAHRIIVPTEIFSARRVRWMLYETFPGDVVALVPAINPPEYRADDWWEDERGWVSFQNEILKYLYYRAKY
jgi:uncharacterized SAM-binding protein YcdF (DUF218 family)